MADFCSCKICTSTVLGGRTGEGTTPGKEEVEPRQERRPRTMHDSMDGGGTSPWTGEGRTMQEQLSRVMHGAITEADAEEAKAGFTRQ